MKFKTLFMHTVDGYPAAFHPLTCSVTKYFVEGLITPVPTLKQIRREQQATKRRHSDGNYDAKRYGYIRLRVPLFEETRP